MNNFQQLLLMDVNMSNITVEIHTIYMIDFERYFKFYFFIFNVIFITMFHNFYLNMIR